MRVAIQYVWSVADGPVLMTGQLTGPLEQWGLQEKRVVDKESSEYKVHLCNYSGMQLKLYNIDCDVISTGCGINKQSLPNPFNVTDCCTKGGFSLPALHFYIHPSFIIPKSIVWYKLHFQNESHATLFTLWIYVNMCRSPVSPYPPPISACTIPVCPVQRWTVYWRHSPSYGSRRLVHNEGITWFFMIFLIYPRVLIAGYQPCLEISYYLSR